MDALILRVALILSCAPSAVSQMQATDVIALAYAQSERDRETAIVRDLAAVRDASLVNLAMWAPEKLRDEDTKIRARIAPAPTNAAFEAMLASAPVVEAE